MCVRVSVCICLCVCVCICACVCVCRLIYMLSLLFGFVLLFCFVLFFVVVFSPLFLHIYLFDVYQAELRKLELQNRKETAALDDQLLQMRTHLLQVTRENTRLLTETADLAHDKKILESSLDTALRSPEEQSLLLKQEEAEHKQLVQLVRLQAAEIESIRQEIGRLMRKDGHVMPPPPKTIDRLPPVHSR